MVGSSSAVVTVRADGVTSHAVATSAGRPKCRCLNGGVCVVDERHRESCRYVLRSLTLAI